LPNPVNVHNAAEQAEQVETNEEGTSDSIKTLLTFLAKHLITENADFATEEASSAKELIACHLRTNNLILAYHLSWPS
jgi:hypothetical protein